jgi:hypothetical protein
VTECDLNARLTHSIQSGRGLIEQQVDVWLAEEDARDCDTLVEKHV